VRRPPGEAERSEIKIVKSNREIVDFIEERIGHIYLRPKMYGGSASGVDLILHYYHELWSEIFDKLSIYKLICDQTYANLNCGSAGFFTKYSMDNPSASDDEVTNFVIDQWIKISENLGVSIPNIKY